MTRVNSEYSHEVMEEVKVPVVLDGDLAATIVNLIGFAAREDKLDELIFCGHTLPKLDALWDTLTEAIDIENKEEK